MNEIMKGYVSVSLSGTLLMAVLLLMCPLYRKRFSKRWQYYIWLVVAARFLVPWNPGDGVVGRLFLVAQEQGRQWLDAQPGKESGQSEASEKRPQTKQGEAAGQSDQEDEKQQAAIMQHEALKSKEQFHSRKAVQRLLEYSWMIWLSGVLILLVRKLSAYRDFVRYLKAGCTPVEDIGRLELFGKVTAQSRLSRMAGLYTNSQITSALLVGLFHPAVILTTTELSDADFYYTVLHEWTHCRRGDLFYKWLVQLVICLHWFNPCVYLLERETSRMCELSCDEAVTKNLDAAEKRAYGDMLLRAVGTAGGFQTLPPALSLHRGKKLMKERLGALMNERKKTKWTAAVSLAAALSLTAGAVAAGAYRIPAAAQETGRDAELMEYKEKASQEEYEMWGITRKNGAFYYQGRQIRIFMDVRADGSFVRFHFDKDGKADVKVRRANDFSIAGVSGLTKQEKREIMEEYGSAAKEEQDEQKKDEQKKKTKPELSVTRLRKGELTEAVREVVKDCKDGVWYVIKNEGIQYLYYNGMTGKYAFQPSISRKKAVIEIADLGGTGEEYVLLAVRGDRLLTVMYHGKAVRYQTVKV